MHRWFHPNLDIVEAERLLLERGQDGSFLVRPSQSCAGHFSLSVRSKNSVSHFKIRHTGDFYDLHPGEQFATLAELIQYYTENQLTERDGEVFELKRPLNSSDPTTERWFHGSIDGIVAEKLIRDKGQNGSFLVRESRSKVGDYVLTVRTKDEQSNADKVTHIMIRHHNNKYDVGGGEKFDSLTDLVEHYKRNPMVETTGTVIRMKYPFNATCITALDINARVNELSKENPQNNNKEGFWEEFEHIQHLEFKVLFNRKIGQEDRNMLKNRYRNILPYDYTRVILKKPVLSLGKQNNNELGNSNKTNNSNNDHHHSHQKQQQQRSHNAASVSGNVHGNNNESSTDVKDDAKDDYINANYIKLVDDCTDISPRTKPLPYSKVYIATQGPLPTTIDDFWWMVWQENSDTIVMVTKEMECGKNKCCRYWPSLEQQKLICGPIEVRIVSESIKTAHEDEYIYREFEICNLYRNDNSDAASSKSAKYGTTNSSSGGNNSNGNNNIRTNGTKGGAGNEIKKLGARRIYQYQYLCWPDRNTPTNPSSVLSFLADVNSRQATGPMIVHCSAGIGRSGALIVIDMLIDQLKHYGLTYEIDIQRIVKVARAQRSGLVQTEAQYKFIYLAIQDFIASMKKKM